MSERTNILARLRRQRSRFGRSVLATFAIASFTIAGAPCFAMAAPAPVAQVDQHAHAQAHGEMQGHGHASAEGIPGAQEQSEHQLPKHCPHCPVTAAMSNHVPSTAHAFCAAVDDVSDQSSSSQLTFAKHVVPGGAFETLAPLAFHPPPRHRLRETARARSTVALNLRHCVFLI